MITTDTMRQICAAEPLFEQFLQSKGFPFSIDNPITEYVTFDDVVEIRSLNKEEFLGEFEDYKRSMA